MREEKERGTRGCTRGLRTGWMVGHTVILGTLDATLNATCPVRDFKFLNRGIKQHLHAEVLLQKRIDQRSNSPCYLHNASLLYITVV